MNIIFRYLNEYFRLADMLEGINIALDFAQVDSPRYNDLLKEKEDCTERFKAVMDVLMSHFAKMMRSVIPDIEYKPVMYDGYWTTHFISNSHSGEDDNRWIAFADVIYKAIPAGYLNYFDIYDNDIFVTPDEAKQIYKMIRNIFLAYESYLE